MKDLIEALKIKKKYNDMDFDVFIKLVEKHIGKEIPQKDKDDFKYTGLNNVDFLKVYTIQETRKTTTQSQYQYHCLGQNADHKIRQAACNSCDCEHSDGCGRGYSYWHDGAKSPL